MKAKRKIIIGFVILLLGGNMIPVQAGTKGPEKILLSESSLTMYAGDTAEISVKSVTPKNSSKKITWKSSFAFKMFSFRNCEKITLQ